MQFLPRLQLIQEALAEMAGRPRECPVGLDDQLVEDRVALKMRPRHVYMSQTIVVCPDSVADVQKSSREGFVVQN